MRAITIIKHDDGSVSVMGVKGDDADIDIVHLGLGVIAMGRKASFSCELEEGDGEN